jgi:hypothetical protein
MALSDLRKMVIVHSNPQRATVKAVNRLNGFAPLLGSLFGFVNDQRVRKIGQLGLFACFINN